MIDIVQRLRNTAAFIAKSTGAENARWVHEAADEIERLRSALVLIDAVAVSKKAGAALRMQSIARKALAPAPPSPIGTGGPKKTDEPPNPSTNTVVHKSSS